MEITISTTNVNRYDDESIFISITGKRHILLNAEARKLQHQLAGVCRVDEIESSKRLTQSQKEAFWKIEAISGLPIISIDKLESGEITADELWSINIKVINDIVADITRIKFPAEGRLIHSEMSDQDQDSICCMT